MIEVLDYIAAALVILFVLTVFGIILLVIYRDFVPLSKSTKYKSRSVTPQVICFYHYNNFKARTRFAKLVTNNCKACQEQNDARSN